MDWNILTDLKNSLTNVLKHINPERLSEILVALILAVLGFVMARVVSNTFIRTLGPKLNLHQRLVWRRGIFYFIFLLFLMASLKEAGFKLSVFLGAAGILTVALGFASQTSASNLISGLFLIGEGSFAVGDTIQITLIRGHTIEGQVISIDLLSVKLLTLDNIYVRLPNEQLIRAPVHNLSKFPIRRIPITLAINFQEDLTKVRQVLLNVAMTYPLVLDEPKPTVTVTAFRESSIELLFAVWCKQQNFFQVRDEMQERIRNGFLDNHIEIPVPKMGLVDRLMDTPHNLGSNLEFNPESSLESNSEPSAAAHGMSTATTSTTTISTATTSDNSRHSTESNANDLQHQPTRPKS